MRETYSDGIIIDSGDETAYPGKLSGFFTNRVATPAEFIVQTKINLDKIASKPIGKDLLGLLGKRNRGIGTGLERDGTGKTVTITNGWGTLVKGNYNTDAGGIDKVAQFAVEKIVKGAGYSIKTAGRGTSVKVRYSVTQDYTKVLHVKTPSFVALAHELVHAYHFMSGNMTSDFKADAEFEFRCHRIEEALTVGAGTFKNTRISENAIRAEHGLPLREYYKYQGDCFIEARDRSDAVY